MRVYQASWWNMIYKVKNVIVEVSENVLNIYSAFIQSKQDAHEAGGIILGHVKDNYIFISKATTPTMQDSSSRNNFERDFNTAQLIVDYEFFNSNGHLIYLGEWHTHPEDTPYPSNQDLKMIKQQYIKNKLNEQFLLLIIIGIKSNYLGLYDGKKLFDGIQI